MSKSIERSNRHGGRHNAKVNIEPVITKNINPRIWGSHLWTVLFCAAISSNENKSSKRQFAAFIASSLACLLPCESCKSHYKKYVNENKITTETDLILWLVNFHNKILLLKGSGEPLTVSKVLKMYPC